MKAKFFTGDSFDLEKSVNSFLGEAGNIRIKKAQMVSTNEKSANDEAEFGVMIFYVKKEED
ncbi:MAG: hypothetical protein NPMRTH1_270044 [Nitrosopumilales archaeon]|nr:MAG: hypothetical protein NPMRTH1_270044 [Nitrosopumilales archaeon]